eukprot:scaffold141008_cov72-Phaeocystis_antarctica.AAC.2
MVPRVTDGTRADVEREVSRETEEMRGEPQLQPESRPSLRARAEQVAALCEQSIASGQPVSRAQISALPAPGAADKACSECSNTNPNPNPSSVALALTPTTGNGVKTLKRRNQRGTSIDRVPIRESVRTYEDYRRSGGGTGVLSRRSYRCGVCNGRFSQLLPSNCGAWHARRALWLHETKVRRMALPGERGTRIGEKAGAHIGDV